jgi:hypothetical protein
MYLLSSPSLLAAGATVSRVTVASTNAQGVRKVKNPTLRLVMSPPTPQAPILWVFVYCPQGFRSASLTLTTGASGSAPTFLFEPNQNAIISGILNPLGTAFW